MKIEILPEIKGEMPNDDVLTKFYETIQVLYNEFSTVPEYGSKIEVDIFKFIFEFTMVDKVYSYDGEKLEIKLVYEKTKEII